MKAANRLLAIRNAELTEENPEQLMISYMQTLIETVEKELLMIASVMDNGVI